MNALNLSPMKKLEIIVEFSHRQSFPGQGSRYQLTGAAGYGGTLGEPPRMIILDTKVLSALMQSIPDEQVIIWLDRQPAESIWMNAINLFEIRYGLAQLTPGRRRKTLEEAFDLLLRDDLEGRVLPFDTSAADHAARLAGERRRTGRPVDMRDTQIAGICEARNATLATRNTRHFEDIRTPVVNPWEDGHSETGPLIPPSTRP